MRKDTSVRKHAETLEEKYSRHGNNKCEEFDVGAMPDLFKRQGQSGWSRVNMGECSVWNQRKELRVESRARSWLLG